MNKLLLLGGATALVSALAKTGQYEMELCSNITHFYHLIRTNTYKAIVLDAIISGVETIELCRQIRVCNKGSALLVLNAHCGQVHQGRLIKSGADDCVIEPIDVRLVLARLQAAIRRRTPDGYANQLVCGHVRLDLCTTRAFCNEQPLQLRPLEYALLEFLMRNQGTIFSVEALSNAVWKRKFGPAESIRAHIYTLRRKTCANNGEMVIHTIHGRGYMMNSRSLLILNRFALESKPAPGAWQPQQPACGLTQPAW